MIQWLSALLTAQREKGNTARNSDGKTLHTLRVASPAQDRWCAQRNLLYGYGEEIGGRAGQSRMLCRKIESWTLEIGDGGWGPLQEIFAPFWRDEQAEAQRETCAYARNETSRVRVHVNCSSKLRLRLTMEEPWIL